MVLIHHVFAIWVQKAINIHERRRDQRGWKLAALPGSEPDQNKHIHPDAHSDSHI